MNMEDFVTYEQAVRLKECGFDWPCTHYYECEVLTSQYEYISGNGYEISVEDFYSSVNLNCPNTEVFDAPTLAQAAKWLREAKDIHVVPVLENVNKADYCCHITQLHKSVKRIIDRDKYFESFESALSAGIDAALELIKRKA